MPRITRPRRLPASGAICTDRELSALCDLAPDAQRAWVNARTRAWQKANVGTHAPRRFTLLRKRNDLHGATVAPEAQRIGVSR